MHKFGFIIHPLSVDDLSRKFPFVDKLPERVLEQLARLAPPVKISEITGIKSLQGHLTEGWFVGCLLTSRLMKELPEDYVLKKIIKAGKKAEELGAEILGLGAFSSVVGDAGITVSNNLNIPVTTGNSYTVYTALEGTRLAARRLGYSFEEKNILIIGATGSIGSACARLLASEVKRLHLLAPSPDRINQLVVELQQNHPELELKWGTDLKPMLSQADIVISASGSSLPLIDPDWIRPGAIICDVARPRDVNQIVAEKRKDVLVIDGGIVRVPGPVEFNFNFGFPEGTCYACMAETIMLALEGRLESFTLGRKITASQIVEISEMAERHGFQLSGLRSFDREVTYEQITSLKERVEAGTLLST